MADEARNKNFIKKAFNLKKVQGIRDTFSHNMVAVQKRGDVQLAGFFKFDVKVHMVGGPNAMHKLADTLGFSIRHMPGDRNHYFCREKPHYALCHGGWGLILGGGVGGLV